MARRTAEIPTPTSDTGIHYVYGWVNRACFDVGNDEIITSEAIVKEITDNDLLIQYADTPQNAKDELAQKLDIDEHNGDLPVNSSEVIPFILEIRAVEVFNNSITRERRSKLSEYLLSQRPQPLGDFAP